MTDKQISAILLDLAVGDALGVPVEFINRSALKCQPATTTQGYGTHQQPPGRF